MFGEEHFVLSYQWDGYCQSLFDLLKGELNRVLSGLEELENIVIEYKIQKSEDGDKPVSKATKESLLEYYKKWHYNKIHFEYAVGEIDKKLRVIRELGYRGFGVNIDLLNAMEDLKRDFCERIWLQLKKTFDKHIESVKDVIFFPTELIEEMNSHSIIDEFCRKLGLNKEENTPKVVSDIDVDVVHYFKIMSEETPWFVNTAIFQKLFLHLGCSSKTIMKGSVGYEDELTPQELKVIGNANFVEVYKETFAKLHKFTEIGVELLKKIHKQLSKKLVPNAGEFRTMDFPDRNGVTFDFDNFKREIKNMEHVLKETAESYHDLFAFIYDLSRSYYMFIGVHPFWDSNGRVGKVFLNHLLLKKGLPPISFDMREEIYALPRYGGTIEDMYAYIKKRIRRAVDAYFYERWKLDEFGFLHKQIYNVAFDSGVYFRQIDDRPQKLEVSFEAYIVRPFEERVFRNLQDYCRVVFYDENQLRNLKVYCGFSKKERGEWQKIFSVKDNIFIKEIASDIPNTCAYDVDFVIELHGQQYECDYFNCSIVSEDGGLIFNNKGLNYSYKMER